MASERELEAIVKIWDRHCATTILSTKCHIACAILKLPSMALGGSYSTTTLKSHHRFNVAPANVTKAWKTQCLRIHPDKHTGHLAILATEAFRCISQAKVYLLCDVLPTCRQDWLDRFSSSSNSSLTAAHYLAHMTLHDLSPTLLNYVYPARRYVTKTGDEKRTATGTGRIAT